MLKQHAKTAGQRCPGLLSKKLSPHVLRHTCAMIVLQATQDIRKVSLWLGHSNLAWQSNACRPARCRHRERRSVDEGYGICP
jgi:site-specific recombinase XerD